MSELPLNDVQIHEFLKEDIGTGDVTTNAISALSSTKSTFQLISKNKKAFILCGVGAFKKILKLNAKNSFNVKVFIQDGKIVNEGDIILTATGIAADFLTSERVVLNIMQHLSGISSMTHEFMKELKGTKIKMLDTRKTLPGLRGIQKYAVKCGGGENHRFGLYDMVLIKDNHIEGAGGVLEAIKSVRSSKYKNLRIEVECDTIEQVKITAKEKVDVIMLDNMKVSEIKTASSIIRNANKNIKIEVSGGVNLKSIKLLKKLDIDYISAGLLTHSVKAVDISASLKLI
jgi:nicotinate-nucleotide pyrophosphorylase (carboxylating)